MRKLSEIIRLNKVVRVIGFDDAPFNKSKDDKVSISGIVCANTRFEGMLWDQVHQDGNDATDIVIRLVAQSKFYHQVNVLLFDGLAFGGFNILDLSLISTQLERPCIAVMRRQPDLTAIDNALQNFSDYEQRKKLIEKAGKIYQLEDFTFQVTGTDAATAAAVLRQLTDTGKVPEALRLAHLIGSAVKTGQSSKRA